MATTVLATTTMNNGETQRVLEAMKMEEEKFKSSKLLAERLLSTGLQPKPDAYQLTGGAMLQPPQPVSRPPGVLDLGVLMPSGPPSSAPTDEALRRRVSSLEESNAVLQQRVGQLESAVAVLARLIDHPLVKQAVNGHDEQELDPPVKLQRVDLKGKASARGSRGALERGQSSSLPAPEKVGRIIARASRDRSAAADDDDPQPSSADEVDEEEGEGEEAAERSVLRSLKRSKSGKPVDMDVSKKKWYELIALIKEMKPNNGYPIKCLILAAIDSARADPVYADSNIPQRLEQSLENYCRKSAGPTKRAALQVLDSVWQFVQQGQAPPEDV